ncbi:hypothetical protein FRC01_013141, partial [Tulasnella sp. 417]
MLLSTLVTALGLASTAHAWGQLGHKTVANVALQFLQPGVRDTLDAILASDGHNKLAKPSIVDVASWADGQSPFQYHVDMTRDCQGPGGCVVTAIANYTNQLIYPSRNVHETAQALMFVVHFFGDITQPLHTGFLARGGNKIMIKWHGARKRLHGVWDTNMIDQLADKNGIYKDSIREWLSCTDINEAVACALQWAIDTNRLICNYVITPDLKGKELSDVYYRGASSIIQQQIAK